MPGYATVGAAVLILAAFAVPALAGPAYTITDLGASTIFGGVAINAGGEVTGGIATAGGTNHAFLYNGSTIQDLGTLGGFYSYGYGINASGEVTGNAQVFGGEQYAFLYNGSTMQDLGTLGNVDTGGSDESAGLGINDSGEVTGYSVYETGSGAYHAFLYNGSTMEDLGTLGGEASQGYGINNHGEVTGVATTITNAAHAFLYNGATMEDLGTLGGTDSGGTAINSSGEVTGNSETAGNLATDPFLYNGSTMVDLGTLGGNYGLGLGINDSGEVVGFSTTAGDAIDAFLYEAGTMYDLNNLISASDPLYGEVAFFEANGINDSGQIIANGCYTAGPLDGQCDAFVLDPAAPPASVPEPPSAALLAGALVGLGVASRRFRFAWQRTAQTP